MTEELISLDTAKLAKEKGFDIDTKAFHSRLDEPVYSLPSQGLLARWLRDIHGWHIILIPVVTMGYTFKITRVWKKDFDPNEVEIETPPYKGVDAYDYSTYEEALENALREALLLI